MFTSFALKSAFKKRGNNFCTFAPEGHRLGSAVVAVGGNGGRSNSMILSETLVENAVAHAPPSTEVTVSIPANAAISVADRGPGIPAEQRKHIFERFWRESGKGSPGAGPGLAVVTEIMKTQRGGISVDDNRGRGIVFTLRFGQLIGW